MNKTAVAATLAGATLLGGSSIALADVSGSYTVDDTASGVSPLTQSVEKQAQKLVTVSDVQGTFAYDQNTVTPNSTIKDVFQKSTAALCNAATTTESLIDEFLISIEGDVPSPYDATLSQIEEEHGSTVQIMGCSCTSNSAGGWAIANSRVEGASIRAIAEEAGL